ncbi:SpoIID/LytB domain-containing protein [Polyangium sorediatum]|uniref:SpoIID/LytB domain-containing protein n=1 Tax=Polyangium sorediatum TaxID=889274 RepID=A0ABT6P2V2_9BACT|nr:SpoIID/LytB domain-containing protein [Polyangium sorediatum]MDI1434936.1 SpoIID/LytB domain-containing protein [Polyangium sorediatum]
MDPAGLRSEILSAWPLAVGSQQITPPELQAVEAVVAQTAWPIPDALRRLYRDAVTAKALKWGEVGAVAEALKWRKWLPVPPPDVLWERKREMARKMREPVWVPVAHVELEEAPERILTVEGWLSLEEEYLPRVCAGEHLHAHPEAKAALVIAARTFVLRAMRDHPTLGRTTPIRNGDMFQAFSREANEECAAAATRTRGFVMRYGGKLILANHVAGAPWREDGSRGPDASGTEKYVTYNYGRSGTDVILTRLALTIHPGNRGCLSQNGAHWLGEHGFDCEGILRFFYGEDVEIVQFEASRGGSVAGFVGLAALGMLWLGVADR